MTTSPMPKDARIMVAGHRGLVGSALLRRLEAGGHTNLITATRQELDLRDQAAVDSWFDDVRPDYVFLSAGTVGGVLANSTHPARFIYDNLLIHATVVHAAHQVGVRKLLCLGSSCIYPRLANQPMREEELLTGALEPTNEAYAIAKIAGIKLCQAYRSEYGDDFISAMPTNLYGINDNFDLASSHLLPALIRKFHEAKLAEAPAAEVWGSGTPQRELLHVDDLADACLFLMEHYSDSLHINIGTGEDLSIRQIAELTRDIVYPECAIQLDPSKPDGMPRKLLDVTRLHQLGWHHKIDLADGIASTYAWYRTQPEAAVDAGAPRG